MAYLDIAGLEYFWSKIKSAFSAIGHIHDDRYYTESEMDLKLLGKSDTSHNHDDSYLKLSGGSVTGDLQVKGVTTLKNTVTITGDCSVDESHNFIGNLNGNASTATNADYATKADSANTSTNASFASLLSGFARATTGQTWGNQTGTFIHGEDDSTGGSFAFRRDNPIAGQMSMIIDGRFYQNEGQYKVLDESDISGIRSRSDMELGVPLSCAKGSNTAPWAGAHDGSLDFAQCRSMIGTVCDNSGTWSSVLSIRHRNGSGDGTNYGLLAFSNLTNTGDTIWYQKQSNGSWTDKRNILDSSNYGSYALPLSGGTLKGSLNFANYTWNLVGDDAYIGDHNIGGAFCVVGANGTTKLALCNQANQSDYAYLGYSGGNITTNKKIEANTTGHADKDLALSGGTMTGDIAFASIGDVAVSNKITWDGSTDSADIYYQTTAADQGNLVLNLRDDGNCYLRIAQNGNFRSYFSPNDGNFHGNVNGNADTASAASKVCNANNSNDKMAFHWSGQGGQPYWLWGGNSVEDMYVYNPSNFSVNYANSAGYAATADTATNSNVTIGSGYMRIGAIQICYGTYTSTTTITYNQAFANIYGVFVSGGGNVGWAGPYAYNVSTTSFVGVAADHTPTVYWMAIGTWK
jgi:hypothetical protein